MAPRTFYRRRFLNRRGYHGGAFVLADIHFQASASAGRMTRDVLAFITIADCSRVVTLDFDIHTATDADNALHKARALRQVITEFVETLERAVTDRASAFGPPD